MSKPHLGKATSKKKKKKVKQELQESSGQEIELSANVESQCEPSLISDRSRCSFNMDKRRACLDFDQESEPDRSNPLWKMSPPTFSEEERMSLVEEKDTRKEPTLWEQIMEEYEKERLDLMSLNTESKSFEPEIPVGRKLTAVQYLEKHIFPLLCPALKETLFRAKKEDCLQIQKCIFNGLDHISEILWNRNPKHPQRQTANYRDIFDIPFVKIWLNYHPRPIYPLSWVWTREEAVTTLQAYIRRYLVCREVDCHEMRKFWQIFKQEKKEKEHQHQLQYLEELQKTAAGLLEEIIANAVFRVEKKMHGCLCTSKPCRCDCKCFEWYECCRCYKKKKLIGDNFRSRSKITAATELKSDSV